MAIIGFRSLKYPAMPDASAPDYDAQCSRFWEESGIWWDNWATNFVRCMVLLLAVFAAAIILILA